MGRGHTGAVKGNPSHQEAGPFAPGLQCEREISHTFWDFSPLSGNEILISVTPQETRVAVVEGGLLQEVHIERPRSRGIVGNIYKGRVDRVLPGMQAAFIDIGLEKAAFLHASDVRLPADLGGLESEGELPRITELLREGQEVVVQVNKDPLGTKGARVSTQITLPSRFLVYMPYLNRVGVSRRIEDAAERERLKEVVEAIQGSNAPGGFIIRTVSEGVTGEEFQREIHFLCRVWESIAGTIRQSRAPALIHQDFSLPVRAIRDMTDTRTQSVRIDSAEVWEEITSFAQEFVPEITDRIEHYSESLPLFDLYSVEEEIERALSPVVYLKSGGSIVFDQTEALTTIDVNTGGFVGYWTLEETVLKTNLEAAQAIARQLRLRNIGGIIIIDFIDMERREHRERVYRALEGALARDGAKTHLVGFSELGLVEMTRKRTRESLERVMCEPCPACKGRGVVKSLQMVCFEIFREVLREAHQYPAEQFLVVAHPAVVETLLHEEGQGLAELEVSLGQSIHLRSESSYSQERYDIVIL